VIVPSFVRNKLTKSRIMLTSLLQGMSGPPHRCKQSSLHIKVQIPKNCEIVIFAGTSFPPFDDTYLKQLPSRFADLTDVDFFLEPLDPSLFRGIPSGVEVHNGFAREQARYAALVALSASHANNDDARKHRVGNPLRRPEHALDERSLVRHRRRPFSRCGARPPRRCLLQPTTSRECDGEGDQLRHAACRESSICQFRR
jgi:hypothetical protein